MNVMTDMLHCTAMYFIPHLSKIIFLKCLVLLPKAVVKRSFNVYYTYN